MESSYINCGKGKYLAIIIRDSAIMCDEIIESYDDVKDFNDKKANCKNQNVLLAFLLVTIALLIAVSICCYLIKHQAI